MLGQMMQMPLMISSLIVHADRYHGDTQIVSRLTEGGIHRYTYADAHRRARQLARALESMGVRRGERIGTLAWNNHRHFEIYYGVSGMGAVCHTINPRLFLEQIAYIINHAEDSYIFFDVSFIELVERLVPLCPQVTGWVAMTDRDHLPSTALELSSYEELVNAHSDDFEWPTFDENTAAALCYTSGTTGDPKGVLYSHRSTLLHATAICLPEVFSLSSRETVLPVVPMFHVNAWGLPYGAPLAGCKLVLAGPGLDGASLYELFEQEQVTFSAGVPTIWMGLIEHLRANGSTLSARPRILVGGAAAPPAMMKALAEEFGATPVHAWGMTEMSPVGTVCSLKGKHLTLSEGEKDQLRVKQGRPLFSVEMEIVDQDGKPLPHDGKAFGELLVRGPGICASYFKGDGGDILRPGGWFATGDVATLDADGYMQITDRSKDVIKSGGEWISSIELENAAAGHPAVAEAAVIGVPHLKWVERPLLVVVRKNDATVSRHELIDFMRSKVAKWWLPDDVVFVDELPHTATGKVLKTKLREAFRNHDLPSA